MLLHPLAIFDGNMRNDSGAREKQRLRQDESVVPIGELGELEKAVVSNRCLGRGTGPKWQRGFVALSAHPHVVLIELDVTKAWVPVDHWMSSMPLNPADRSAHSMHAEGGHNNEKRHCRIEPGWYPSGGVHVRLPFAVSRLIRSQPIMGSRLARCNHTGRGHSKKARASGSKRQAMIPEARMEQNWSALFAHVRKDLFQSDQRHLRRRHR